MGLGIMVRVSVCVCVCEGEYTERQKICKVSSFVDMNYVFIFSLVLCVCAHYTLVSVVPTNILSSFIYTERSTLQLG